MQKEVKEIRDRCNRGDSHCLIAVYLGADYITEGWKIKQRETLLNALSLAAEKEIRVFYIASDKDMQEGDLSRDKRIPQNLRGFVREETVYIPELYEDGRELKVLMISTLPST